MQAESLPTDWLPTELLSGGNQQAFEAWGSEGPHPSLEFNHHPLPDDFARL